MTGSRGWRSLAHHKLLRLDSAFMLLRKWYRQRLSPRSAIKRAKGKAFPVHHFPSSPYSHRTQPDPFFGLFAGDPGTRALVRADGRGLPRFASIPGSIDSPHNRQRHPTTASELDDSCIRLTTMRPWQREHCIESSSKSNLQHLPQCIGPYNACIDRLRLTSMTMPKPAPPDKHQEADHAKSPSVNIRCHDSAHRLKIPAATIYTVPLRG